MDTAGRSSSLRGELGTVLTPEVRRRFALAGALAVGLAVVEAAALALVVPLMALVTADEGAPIPESARWFADRLHDPTPLATAALVGGAVLVMFLVRGSLSVLYLRWSLRFLVEAEAETGRRLLTRYLAASPSFHWAHNSAELQRTMQVALPRLFREALAGVVGMVADLAVLLTVAVVLTIIDPPIAAVASIYFLLVAGGYQALIHDRLARLSTAVHDEVAASYRHVQQAVTAQKEIAVIGTRDHFVSQYFDAERSLARRTASLILLGQAPRYYLEVALVAGAAIIGTGTFALRGPDEGLATLGLFLVAGFRALPSLNRVLVAAGQLRTGRPALRQIAADLALPQPFGTGHDSDRIVDGPIAISDVSFRYEGADRTALQAIDLLIHPGESLAIVGRSGSGKSTLVDLLLGLVEPTAGSITVGKEDLRAVGSRWRSTIGFVPQAIAVLDDSIAANVTFGRALDEEQVWAALERAQLGPAVAGLPGGLLTPVGEAGRLLSGGERQRLGLARALYGGPRVLILDEATSALDTRTEAEIGDAIAGLAGEVTVIVVAHRLSTVQKCERVVLLDEGRVVAVGSFGELVERSAEFAAMVRLGSLPT